jgi:hypothetical protein
MDRAIIEAQLVSLQAQFAMAPAGSPQAVMLEQQIAVLQNELADEPIVPPIFFHGGGVHGGPHGR